MLFLLIRDRQGILSLDFTLSRYHLDLNEILNHHVADFAHEVLYISAYVTHVGSVCSLVDKYKVECVY